MRPRTETMAKAMLPVAGRPFVDWQLRWLAAEGATRVVLSVGHCGNQIESYVADGARWRLDVRYAWERQALLGTAGAIRHAADAGLLDEEFFVLYGDSYLQVELSAVERAFRRSGKSALMTVFRNGNRWDRSNVLYKDGQVVLYKKSEGPETADMEYIDYGLLVLTRDLIVDAVDPLQRADLSPLLTKWSELGKLAGFEARDRFFEGGSPEGLEALETFLKSTAGATSGSTQVPGR
jgi:NDP-sugar pyrophosphorylase family protein